MFYTMESVRNQIAGKYSFRTEGDLPDSWNRYPCKIEAACARKENISCKGYVEITLNLPYFSTALLEVLFFRPKRKAFIREENTQLKKLIENHIIDKNKLERVS